MKLSKVSKQYIGGTIDVYLGFWDRDREAYVGGFHLYSGYIDRTNLKTSAEEKITTVLECTGQLSNLELVKGYIGSDQGRKQVSQTDTSYENISDAHEGIKKYWGKF